MMMQKIAVLTAVLMMSLSSYVAAKSACHEIASKNSFDKDVTHFRYCQSQPSTIELSPVAMAEAPVEFKGQRGLPAGLHAEIRFASGVIPAEPQPPWRNIRGKDMHNLVIASSDDAMKLAKAINAGETMTLALMSAAGNEMIAYSGQFEMTFPAHLVATQQNANPASAVKKSTTAVKAVSYTDPIGEDCAKDQRLSQLYDCACIAEQAAPARLQIVEQRFAEQQKYIPKRTKAVESIQQRLAKASSDKQKQSLLRMLERAEKQLAELKVKPDSSSISNNSVAMFVYKDNTCKVGSYIKAKERQECLKSASSISGVTNPEAFCECSGDKMAELWRQSNEAYSSKTHIKLAVKARGLCR